MGRWLVHQTSMKDQLHHIRDALEEMRLPGLDIKVGTIRYSHRDAKVTLTFMREGTDSPELEALKRYHPDLAGKTFKSAGHEFELIGFKPKSPRFPFIAKRDDDKNYKFPRETVYAYFGLDEFGRKRSTA